MSSFTCFLAFLLIAAQRPVSANTEDTKEAALRVHNHYRKLVLDGKVPGQPAARAMPMLQWDNELAEKAQSWADACNWGHNPNRKIAKYGSVGENVALHKSLDNAITAWFGEYRDYNLQNNKCSKVCGHYTQVVWAKTTHVGCGVKKCNKGGIFQHNLFIVCNYGPAGNFRGQKPYEAK